MIDDLPDEVDNQGRTDKHSLAQSRARLVKPEDLPEAVEHVENRGDIGI